MNIISKEFHFSAAHQLYGLAPDHPCARLHGHNYVVRIFLKGEPDPKTGFVVDFNELDVVKEFIDGYWDHRNLNDYFTINKKSENTTVENMSRFLYNTFKDVFPQLYAVEMSETPKTNCRYEP